MTTVLTGMLGRFIESSIKRMANARAQNPLAGTYQCHTCLDAGRRALMYRGYDAIWVPDWFLCTCEEAYRTVTDAQGRRKIRRMPYRKGFDYGSAVKDKEEGRLVLNEGAVQIFTDDQAWLLERALNNRLVHNPMYGRLEHSTFDSIKFLVPEYISEEWCAYYKSGPPRSEAELAEEFFSE